MRIVKLGLVCAGMLLVAGCNSVGPTTIPRDRFDYSGALAESWKSQTLLNLVKMRYLDLPVYLEVGQIVSGYTVETTGTAGGEIGNPLGGTQFFGLEAKRKFTDRPTVTYTPLTGNRFLESFLTPIAPAKLLALMQSGFDADFVLELGVESLNGLRNRPVNIGAKHKADADFFRVLALLHDIQDERALGVRVEHPRKDRTDTIVFFRRDRTHAGVLAKIEELRKLLRLAPGRFEFRLVESPVAVGGDTLAISTRSLLQVMTALSLGVEVPPEDLRRGLTPAMSENVTGDVPLLRVRSGIARPEHSFVAVSYERKWFWVANDDWRSKRTFSSILFLFTLANEHAKGLPVLTIPAQ